MTKRLPFVRTCVKKPQQILNKNNVDLQLESTFTESALVKRTHLETLRDWQKDKPLDMLLTGKLDLSTVHPGKIRPSPKTDETVRKCMAEFREDLFKVTMFTSGDEFTTWCLLLGTKSSTCSQNSCSTVQIGLKYNFSANRKEHDRTRKTSQILANVSNHDTEKLMNFAPDNRCRPTPCCTVLRYLQHKKLDL